MNATLAAVMVCLAAGQAEGEAGRNWPAFRGDGSSRTAAHGLPLEWDADRGVAWSVELPGYGQSSPVIWGDRVFVASMEGEKKETALVLCIDLASGRQLWRRESETSQQVEVSPYVSRGAPTPAVDEHRVYAFFESGDLAAFTHQGEPLWRRSLTKEYGPFQGNHGLGSSPALTSDALILLIAHEGPSYLLAVDKRTGKNRWKIDRPAAVSWSSPIVDTSAGEAELFLSSSGVVEALDPGDGSRRWSVEGLEGNLVPSATVGDELVVIGSSAAGSNLAVRRGGAGDVGETHVAWRLEEAACSFGSPLLYRGRAYFVNRSGVAHCVDAATGKSLWQHRLDASCWASPIAAGDRIYFFTKSGATTVIAPADKYEALAENRLETEDPVVGVAAVDGRFVIRTPRRLVCVAGER